MLPHSLARAVAALAPGKRVTVVSRGAAYELPRVEDQADAAVHPLETVATRLLQRDAETRATVAAFSERADQALNAVTAAVAGVAGGQADVARSVQQIAATMAQPVEPVYDDEGKLIGARRVKKLGV